MFVLWARKCHGICYLFHRILIYFLFEYRGGSVVRWCSFWRPWQLRVRVANESETVGHRAFRFLFIVVGCKLLSCCCWLQVVSCKLPTLLLAILKCSIKLVQSAIAQEPQPSRLLLGGSDIFVFYGFLQQWQQQRQHWPCRTKILAKKQQQHARENAATGFLPWHLCGNELRHVSDEGVLMVGIFGCYLSLNLIN